MRACVSARTSRETDRSTDDVLRQCHVCVGSRCCHPAPKPVDSRRFHADCQRDRTPFHCLGTPLHERGQSTALVPSLRVPFPYETESGAPLARFRTQHERAFRIDRPVCSWRPLETPGRETTTAAATSSDAKGTSSDAKETSSDARETSSDAKGTSFDAKGTSFDARCRAFGATCGVACRTGDAAQHPRRRCHTARTV